MDLVNLLNKPAEAAPAQVQTQAPTHAHTQTPDQTPSLDFGSKSPSPDQTKSRHNSESAPASLAQLLSSGPAPVTTAPTRAISSRAAARGRQPWSAGGYSLPLLPEGKEEVQVAPLSSRPPIYRGTSFEQSPHEHGYSMSNSSDTFYRHHLNSSSRLSSTSLVTPR